MTDEAVELVGFSSAWAAWALEGFRISLAAFGAASLAVAAVFA
jgi:hypothetical protein